MNTTKPLSKRTTIYEVVGVRHARSGFTRPNLMLLGRV